jgi:hypothetical protein
MLAHLERAVRGVRRVVGLIGRSPALVSLAVAMRVSCAGAQATGPSLAPELRADAIVAQSTAFQLGGGAALSTGDYLWLGADVGFGVVTGRTLEPSASFDVTGRFHLDSDGDVHWAPYLVGGMTYRADRGARGALYLLIALGVHAPARAGIVPAVEAGLGGGVRVGIVLRRVSRRR